MRKIFFCLSFVFFFSSFFGQYKRHMVEGNLLLLEGNYMRALQEFMKAYAYDSTNSNINFKIGFCYLKHPSEKHLAEQYLERAVKNVNKNYDEEDPMEKSSPPMAYLYLGQAFHLDYKFDDALKMFDTYESYLNPKRFKSEIELVQHYKEMSNRGQERYGAPANVLITNMGDSVNSEYAEVSPVLSADERMLIFTYSGPLATGAASMFRTPDDGYFEDIFVCYKRSDGTWTTPDTLSANVNGTGHEGAVGLTSDGQTLLIYRDDNGDGNLYYSTWDGADWSFPIKFGPEINSASWEPSACLSPDGNTLYFVSDRPGGFGGRDIYRCKKLPSGRWGLAQNLGPKINTKWDEESPFLHPNGEDFFFSSQGHASMGGFDIMVSLIDSAGGFGDVIPLPYPINTTDDDEFYTASPDNKRAYYASAHEDRSGYGEHDIYMITMSQPLDVTDVGVLFIGKVVAEKGDTLPQGITIVVTNKMSGDPVGIYRPQKNGNFTSILKPKNTYVFSYQLDGKEFFMEEITVEEGISYQEIEREVPLKVVKIDPTVTTTPAQKLTLEVLVFDNAKDKNPVAGCNVVITDKDGKSETLTTDAAGKISGYNLKKDNSYKIVASREGKNSETAKVSTAGVTGNNTYAKTLYVGKPVATSTVTVIDPPATSILLDVLVKDLKTQKPLAGSKIKITDSDGGSFDLTADDNGKNEGVTLEAGKTYTITASMGELPSKSVTLSTKGISGNKKFSKTILISSGPEETYNVVNAVSGSFLHFFEYNRTEVEENPNYKQFLADVEKAVSTNGRATIKIGSSSSQVPTKFAGGNKGLAKARAENMKKLLVDYLSSKGIDASKVTFKLTYRVGGPTYNSDYLINKRTYEKFQYVDVKLM
jgi:hypothetical protein